MAPIWNSIWSTSRDRAVVGLGVLSTTLPLFYYYNARHASPILTIPELKLEHETSIDQSQGHASSPTFVDLDWYPPAKTYINNLSHVIHGSGAYGFIFNSSTTPDGIPYSTYNYCNMPRVRAKEYKVPDPDYELKYVELIHRHHKRTPYAANTFPHEQDTWDCSDSKLYHYASSAADPSSSHDVGAAQINWQISPSNVNPFKPPGFPNSSCQFPQITSTGLQDSHQHGVDLRSVYVDLLSFLPQDYDENKIKFRVTHNVITSQVASQVVRGLYPSLDSHSVAVHLQPSEIDSLEPRYTCPRAKELSSRHGIGSNDAAWLEHLIHPKSKALFKKLDRLTGVNASDPDWHDWFDHYFDNLSSKMCHGKPLGGCLLSEPSSSAAPKNNNNNKKGGGEIESTGNDETTGTGKYDGTIASKNGECISTQDAHTVFRHALYEYSYLYRDSPHSLAVSTASFGVWIAELASHIRDVIKAHNHDDPTSPLSSPILDGEAGGTQEHKRSDNDSEKGKGKDRVIYRHNIAHDGSVSKLLSILQVDVMVWPGMGSEVVFELYKRRQSNGGGWFVRVLWKGEPLRSSSPTLRGDGGMVPVERFLGYIDGLVGVNAVKVRGLCGLDRATVDEGFDVSKRWNT